MKPEASHMIAAIIGLWRQGATDEEIVSSLEIETFIRTAFQINTIKDIDFVKDIIAAYARNNV